MAALEPEQDGRAERNLAAMRADSGHPWAARLLGAIASHGADLTAYETRVLRATSFGMTEPMVADTLGTSRTSVKGHLRACRLKLGAKNTTHAVALAIRCGAIQ